MALVPLLMPQLGESIAEATIIKVLLSEGDIVEADKHVIEVETNKAVMEVTSPCGGKMSQILVEEGATQLAQAAAAVSWDGFGGVIVYKTKPPGMRAALILPLSSGQASCWIPASIQPVAPDLGLARFHTSWNASGSASGAGFIEPWNLTLAR